MNKEQIVNIINSLEVHKTIDQNDAINFLSHYIYSTKGKYVSYSEIINLTHVFAFENMLRDAAGYFKKALNLLTVSRHNEILKVC